MRLGNHRAFLTRVSETVSDRATLGTQTVKRPKRAPFRRNLPHFVDLLLTRAGGMQIPHKISLAGF